jgi:hypothetical protein
MREEKPDLNALVDEEAKITGLTAEVIRDAVQREIASLAAKRILDKLKPSPPGGMQAVKLAGV